MGLDLLAASLDDYLLRGVGSPDDIVVLADSFDSGFVSKTEFLGYLGFSGDFDLLSSLSNLVRLLVYLKDNLGLTKSEQQFVVNKFPNILCLSVDDGSETSLPSKVSYFNDVLGISPMELGVIVKKLPNILGLSIDGSSSSLPSKVSFFDSVLGISPKDLGVIVKKFPSLLSLSVVDGSETGLPSKVSFFDSVLGISPMELGSIVMRNPALLSYSVVDDGSETNLRSKINFYLNDYGLSLSEFIDLIKRNPKILGFSVKSNIEPKVYYLRLKGKLNDYKLSIFTSVKRFCKMIGDTDTSIYNSFKDNWVYLTSNRGNNLGLNKCLLDYERLINYSINDLRHAYNRIVANGLVNDLTRNPNLIFDYC